MAIALGLDPSIRATGYSVIDVDQDNIVKCGCIVTVPDNNFRLKSEQYVSNVRYISDTILSIIEEYKPNIICMELPAGSQNASAATKTALTIGAIIGIYRTLNIPVANITPRGLKKAVTGNSSASKDDIIKAVTDKYLLAANFDKWTKKTKEAVADSIAAYMALKNNDVFLAATQER